MVPWAFIEGKSNKQEQNGEDLFLPLRGYFLHISLDISSFTAASMLAPLTGVTPMYSLCFLGYSFGQKLFCKEDTYKNLDLVRIGLAGSLVFLCCP